MGAVIGCAIFFVVLAILTVIIEPLMMNRNK